MMHGRWMGFITVSVLAFGLSACTTMRPVELAGDGALPATIEADDRISIVDARGTTTELAVTAVGADFIEGLGSDGQPVRIATAEVSELRERRVSAVKLGLGFGIALALFVEALSGLPPW